MEIPSLLVVSFLISHQHSIAREMKGKGIEDSNLGSSTVKAF